MHPLFQNFYAGAAAELIKVKTSQDLKAVQAKAHSQIDKVFTNELSTSGKSIACRDGCSFCCYLKVDVQPGEAFLIADYIRSRFSDEERNEIQKKARENWKKIETMTSNEHFIANLPCPLLKDNRCSVYAVRPATCRMFHAQTVQTCKKSFEKPNIVNDKHSLVPSVRIACGVAHTGVTKAFEALGFDAQAYDLNPAILEALENPHTEKRWRNKKSAFPQNIKAKQPDAET